MVLTAGFHHPANIYMEEENSLANIQQEGSPAETVMETPSESQPESNQPVESSENQLQEPENQEPVQKEEELPWHKDPRFKAWQKEQKELRKTVEELLPLREKVQQFEQNRSIAPPSGGYEQKPQWFLDQYGDNQEAWQQYKSLVSQISPTIKEDIKREMKEEQERQIREAKKMEKWVEDQIDSLHDEGEEFDRNELKKIMEMYQPTIVNNNQVQLDFRKGLLLLKELKKLEAKPEKIKARQEIAAFTSSSNSGAVPPAKDYFTSKDLRGR